MCGDVRWQADVSINGTDVAVQRLYGLAWAN